jgi:hypothetical protein
MALVLNGSGSITGLSAGGLPDGSVTADDIASLPAGSVIQVLEGTYSTETAFTSTTFIATSTSVSITPSSASNKILISAVLPLQSGSSGVISYTIYRDATNLGSGSGSGGLGRWYIPSSDTNATMLFLDAPSTTSAITYEVYIKATSGTHYINIGDERSSIIVQEIAA